VQEAVEYYRKETGHELIGSYLCRTFKSYGEVTCVIIDFDSSDNVECPFTVWYSWGKQERLSWNEVMGSMASGPKEGACKSIVTPFPGALPSTTAPPTPGGGDVSEINRLLAGMRGTPAALDVNQLVECEDEGFFHPARVTQVDNAQGKARVHFLGWHSRHDQVLDLSSSRLRLPREDGDGRGGRVEAPGMLPPTVNTMDEIRNFIRGLDKTSTRTQSGNVSPLLDLPPFNLERLEYLPGLPQPPPLLGFIPSSIHLPECQVPCPGNSTHQNHESDSG
jgi:hypothetical protein